MWNKPLFLLPGLPLYTCWVLLCGVASCCILVVLCFTRIVLVFCRVTSFVLCWLVLSRVVSCCLLVVTPAVF